jgi:hypothetical protein
MGGNLAGLGGLGEALAQQTQDDRPGSPREAARAEHQRKYRVGVPTACLCCLPALVARAVGTVGGCALANSVGLLTGTLPCPARAGGVVAAGG